MLLFFYYFAKFCKYWKSNGIWFLKRQIWQKLMKPKEPIESFYCIALVAITKTNSKSNLSLYYPTRATLPQNQSCFCNWQNWANKFWSLKFSLFPTQSHKSFYSSRLVNGYLQLNISYFAHNVTFSLTDTGFVLWRIKWQPLSYFKQWGLFKWNFVIFKLKSKKKVVNLL